LSPSFVDRHARHDFIAGRRRNTVVLNINKVNTKIVAVGNWTILAKITVGNKVLQDCGEFCYSGSTTSQDGGCERKTMIWLRMSGQSVWKDGEDISK
jgi:hypothetical protein